MTITIVYTTIVYGTCSPNGWTRKIPIRLRWWFGAVINAAEQRSSLQRSVLYVECCYFRIPKVLPLITTNANHLVYHSIFPIIACAKRLHKKVYHFIRPVKDFTHSVWAANILLLIIIFLKVNDSSCLIDIGLQKGIALNNYKYYN